MSDSSEDEPVPFAIGEVVLALCRFTKKHCKARILDIKPPDRAYVHFIDQDARLDGWTALISLRHIPVARVRPVIPVTRRRAMRDQDAWVPLDGDYTPLPPRTPVTCIRNIERLTIGTQTFRPWYFSPYPVPFRDEPHLYICEYCWRYFGSQAKLDAHLRRSEENAPMGLLIYRVDNLCVYELRGCLQKLQCQNLSLLGKLFIDHKACQFDIDDFDFYVLYVVDDEGMRFVGYFSRDLESETDDVVSSIVILPHYRRRGYGGFLIDVSYEISRRCERIGGPERPLSDLGRDTFLHFWKARALEALLADSGGTVILKDLIEGTWIQKKDLIQALNELGVGELAKGKWLLGPRNTELIAVLEQFPVHPRKLKIDPEFLLWARDHEVRDPNYPE